MHRIGRRTAICMLILLAVAIAIGLADWHPCALGGWLARWC